MKSATITTKVPRWEPNWKQFTQQT